MSMHTFNGTVPHPSFASDLPLGSTTQYLPSQHQPVSLPALFYHYLLPHVPVRCGQSSASPPIFHSIPHPMPPHPSPCPSPAHSTLQALPHRPFRGGKERLPPRSIALLLVNQIQFVLLLLKAVVSGGILQYAQMGPLGNLTADTGVITTKHMWTAIFHRCTVLLVTSRFQRNN